MALFLSGGCVVAQRSTYRKGQRHSFLVAAKGLLYGLSLLIFLLAMGIWVRSYFVSDSLYSWSNQQDTTQYPIVSNTLGRSMGARHGALVLTHSRTDGW